MTTTITTKALDTALIPLIVTCVGALNKLEPISKQFEAIEVYLFDIQFDADTLVSYHSDITYYGGEEPFSIREFIAGSPTERLMQQFELEVHDLVGQHAEQLKYNDTYTLTFDLVKMSQTLSMRLKRTPDTSKDNE